MFSAPSPTSAPSLESTLGVLEISVFCVLAMFGFTTMQVITYSFPPRFILGRKLRQDAGVSLFQAFGGGQSRAQVVCKCPYYTVSSSKIKHS